MPGTSVRVLRVPDGATRSRGSVREGGEGNACRRHAEDTAHADCSLQLFLSMPSANLPLPPPGFSTIAGSREPPAKWAVGIDRALWLGSKCREWKETSQYRYRLRTLATLEPTHLAHRLLAASLLVGRHWVALQAVPHHIQCLAASAAAAAPTKYRRHPTTLCLGSKYVLCEKTSQLMYGSGSIDTLGTHSPNSVVRGAF
jgi:hypothetical protein